MKKYALYFAWAVSLISTIASLFLSDGLHWTPCILCWYQRIAMYPLFVILTVGVLRDSDDLEYFVLPLSIIGLIISFFHNLLQYKIIPEALAPCVAGVSCTIPYHFYFQFLTVPLLSFFGFLAITISIFIYRKSQV